MTKSFARFAESEGIENTLLLDAVQRAESGLVDADLRGGVIKLPTLVAHKGLPAAA